MMLSLMVLFSIFYLGLLVLGNVTDFSVLDTSDFGRTIGILVLCGSVNRSSNSFIEKVFYFYGNFHLFLSISIH